MILSDFISSKYYLIEDTLENFKWKITVEQKQILNYSCIKATTSFRGRNYEAWFTKELKINNGPWKFCGLPGLILSAKDYKGMYSFDASSVELGAKYDDSVFQIPAYYNNQKRFQHKEFMEKYYQTVSDLKIQSDASEILTPNGSSKTTQTIPEKMEKN